MEQLSHEKYQQALTNVRMLMKLKPQKNSVEWKQLEALITMIENYEEIFVPMTSSEKHKD